MLTAVSLFAGVGGFDIALTANGAKVAAAVEIDPAARGVLKHRFPETTLFEDVKDVTGEQLIGAGFVPDRGVIVGGFPCQDLSVAGKRAGLDGGRSGLFWEICRLLDETKPKWVVLENVPGLLSSKSGRDMGVVIGALVERGYGISWRVLDAQHFGVPQRRRRVFIVGCLGDDGRLPAQVLAIAEGSGGNPFAGQPSRQNTSTATSAGAGGGSRAGNFELYDFPDSEVAPTLSAARARDTLTYRMRGFGDYEEDSTASALKARDHKDATDLVVNDSDAVLMRQREGKAGGGKGPLLSVEKSLTISTGNDQVLFPPATFVKAGRARSSEDAETWREDDVSPTLNVFDNGGDTRATVLAYGYDEFNDQLNEELHHTLRAGTRQSTGALTSVVRRLTPTECERLQGFPDGWTAERFDYKKQEVKGQPDSARYKQMGNAVAVPVVSWIISRLVAVDSNV